MQKVLKPNVARRIMGGVFTLVGLVNLAANFLWLRSGDIHQPQLHISMRGGWQGFWFTTIVAVLLGVTGIFFLFTKEPNIESKNKKELSKEEKDDLKKWQATSLLSFVLVWALFIPVMIFFSSNYVAITAVLLFAACCGFMMFSKRCPNCGYRLAYYSQLVLPKNCPNCQIPFKG